MTEDDTWVDVGHVDDFSTTPLKRVTAMNRHLAVSLQDGKFGAVSNACNHVGGPLGDGRLDGDYIVCPGTIGNFTAVAALASLASKRIAYPLIP